MKQKLRSLRLFISRFGFPVKARDRELYWAGYFECNRTVWSHASCEMLEHYVMVKPGKFIVDGVLYSKVGQRTPDEIKDYS